MLAAVGCHGNQHHCKLRVSHAEHTDAFSALHSVVLKGWTTARHSHRISHVHHRFGKVLRLSGLPTKLDELTEGEKKLRYSQQSKTSVS